MTEPHLTWEYQTVPASPPPNLAALGHEGWELVAAAGPPDAPTLYFKRPAPTFRERVTLDQKQRAYAHAGHPVVGVGPAGPAGHRDRRP